jgi:hypothetical protein
MPSETWFPSYGLLIKENACSVNVELLHNVSQQSLPDSLENSRCLTNNFISSLYSLWQFPFISDVCSTTAEFRYHQRWRYKGFKSVEGAGHYICPLRPSHCLYSFWALLCFVWTLSEDCVVDCVWNVMEHAQKTDFVFRRNGRVHLNRRGRQFSRLLAAELCASAVVMLDTPCSEVVWRVLATHYIRQFPLHFPCRASPCAITFQLVSTSSSYAKGETGGT